MSFNIYQKSNIPLKIRQLNISSCSNKNYSQFNENNLVLQIASILGLEFERNALESLYLKSTGRNIGKEISSLFFVEGNILRFKSKETHEISIKCIEQNVLTTLHILAAETYEELHNNNSNEYLSKILNHYKLSNNIEKYRQYLWLQAKYYVLSYNYSEAKIAYFQLLELEDDIKKKFDLIIKIGEVYRNASEWSEEIIFYEKYLSIFSGYYKDELIVRLCELYILKGTYDKYKELLKKLSKKEKRAISLKLQIIQANYELNRGNYYTSLKIIDDLLIKTKGELYNEASSLKGIILAKQHRYDDSISVHKSLYENSVETTNKQMMVKSLINIAEGYFYKGNYPIAKENYELALRISKKIQRKNAEAICLGNLGTISYVKNEYQQAISYFVKQLRIFYSIGNRSGIANAYGMLGACMISSSKFKKAIKFLEKQYEIVKQLKTKKSLAICLGNMGVVYNLIGKFDLAIKQFNNQSKIDYEIKNYEGIFRATGNIGSQYFYKGKYNISKKYLQKAIAIANKYKINLNLESVLYRYSVILFELKEFHQSRIYADEASLLSAKVNNFLIKISSNIVKEKTTLYSNSKQQKTDEVLKCCNKILSLKGSTDDLETIALIYYEIWKIAADFRLQYNSYKRSAIKYYTLLYKDIPKFEFKQKLIQLSS